VVAAAQCAALGWSQRQAARACTCASKELNYANAGWSENVCRLLLLGGWWRLLYALHASLLPDAHAMLFTSCLPDAVPVR
jgi:hypothetical protein